MNQDSLNEAYIAGLVAGDGCVFRRGVVLDMNEQDSGQLLRNIAALFDRPVYYHKPKKGREAAWLYLPDGDHAWKTQVPDLQSVAHEREYVRGLIDSDGSLWWAHDRGYVYPAMAFYWNYSQSFLGQFFQDWLISHGARFSLNPREKTSSARVTRSWDVTTLANYLYSSASLFIPRKQELAVAFKHAVPV